MQRAHLLFQQKSTEWIGTPAGIGLRLCPGILLSTRYDSRYGIDSVPAAALGSIEGFLSFLRLLCDIDDFPHRYYLPNCSLRLSYAQKLKYILYVWESESRLTLKQTTRNRTASMVTKPAIIGFLSSFFGLAI